MKNEPKNWYKAATKRWSARIEDRVYEFYTFGEVNAFADMFMCVNTIQYKA